MGKINGATSAPTTKVTSRMIPTIASRLVVNSRKVFERRRRANLKGELVLDELNSLRSYSYLILGSMMP